MTEAVLDVTTVHLPERTLAYIRNVGPYAGNTVLFEQLFNRVSKWALGKGLRSDSQLHRVALPSTLLQRRPGWS